MDPWMPYIIPPDSQRKLKSKCKGEPSKKKFRITIAMHLLTPCTKYAKGVIGSYKSKKHSSHFVILIFLTFKLIEKAKYIHMIKIRRHLNVVGKTQNQEFLEIKVV
jgi:hypothetical protein